MQLKLVMFTDQGERRDFPIVDAKATIGRNTEANIQIPLSMVSRRHCEIVMRKDEVLVRDLGSSNGTFVNKKRVQEVQLKAGDLLSVGPVVFTVVIDDQPDQIKPIPTILDGKKKGKRSKGEKLKVQAKTEPKSAADTGESIDLAGSGTPDMDEIEIEEEEDEGHNPLAELEALSKRKKV